MPILNTIKNAFKALRLKGTPPREIFTSFPPREPTLQSIGRLEDEAHALAKSIAAEIDKLLAEMDVRYDRIKVLVDQQDRAEKIAFDAMLAYATLRG